MLGIVVGLLGLLRRLVLMWLVRPKGLLVEQLGLLWVQLVLAHGLILETQLAMPLRGQAELILGMLVQLCGPPGALRPMGLIRHLEEPESLGLLGLLVPPRKAQLPGDALRKHHAP